MQNMEELRQKGRDGSKKMTCRERGKKYHFQRGGGINTVFGPKFRPLHAHLPKPLTELIRTVDAEGCCLRNVNVT
jgi:hypothetical protein